MHVGMRGDLQHLVGRHHRHRRRHHVAVQVEVHDVHDSIRRATPAAVAGKMPSITWPSGAFVPALYFQIGRTACRGRWRRSSASVRRHGDAVRARRGRSASCRRNGALDRERRRPEPDELRPCPRFTRRRRRSSRVTDEGCEPRRLGARRRRLRPPAATRCITTSVATEPGALTLGLVLSAAPHGTLFALRLHPHDDRARC